MNPVAFTIFGIDIMWYAIIATASMILGTLITLYYGKKEGYKEDHILDIALWGFPIGIICARLYYVAFEWDYYSQNLMEIFNIRGGGLAFHGGVIGGLIAIYIVVKHRKMNFWKLGDILATAMPISQALGRWGNFVNQEAHGGPTDLPWGIMVDGVKVHPTFLYESLWNIGLFLILLRLRKNKKYDGQLMGIYCIGYSIGRFWIEGLRTDSLMIGPLRIAQVVCLGSIVFGILLMHYKKNSGIKPAYLDENIKLDEENI